MYNLAPLLQQTDRGEEAETWYRQAAEAGHLDAMGKLGALLQQTGRTEEAGKWRREAAAKRSAI